MNFENKYADSIREDLIRRPLFSIRTRIAIGFLLTFILTFVASIFAMMHITGLANKQRFLQNANNFEFEIQQARRFEKNYFLYNTNLAEALNHVQKARSILIFFKEDMSRVMGEDAFEEISEQLARYKDSIEKLVALGSAADSTAIEMRHSLEPELRRASSKIAADYLAAVERERLRVRKLADSTKVITVLGLLLVLAIQILMATFVINHVLRPFKRFEKYFQRISSGDFSLITPARKYRDEFSDLAIAVNSMITELNKRQEQIIHSRKMGAIGTLTAGIAHELNNPLNNINITIESILDSYKVLSDEKKKKLLRDAFGQAERAGIIVRNLLDFSRYRETHFEGLSINDLINDSLKLVANEIALNNIQLKLNLGKSLPKVEADRNKMQQVFINLFLNAIQAMPDGGDLEADSYIEGRYVAIDITDNGIGMSPDIRRKIFEPFFTTKDPGKGTGLGLSVVYGIIEKHNGAITAKSVPGKGSTFSIRLPIPEKEFE